MKAIIAGLFLLLFESAGYGQVQFYFGVRGGAGALFTHDKLDNMNTSSEKINVLKKTVTWAANAKGELILGIGKFRIGYQFLYSYSPSHIVSFTDPPTIDNVRNTTYFNSARTNLFGNYFLLELAVINKQHFALTPGVLLGTFVGFKVDETTNAKAKFAASTNHRFTAGLEINAEIKFGRCVIFISPNYYYFQLVDTSNKDWKEKQHFVGGDLGFRVNLIKKK